MLFTQAHAMNWERLLLRQGERPKPRIKGRLDILNFPNIVSTQMTMRIMRRNIRSLQRGELPKRRQEGESGKILAAKTHHLHD